MFQKLCVGIILGTILICSCSKGSSGGSSSTCYILPSDSTAPDSQVVRVQQYLTANSIVAIKDSLGFFYTIQDSGTTKPDLCSTISVNYSGSLTNGAVFDSTGGTPRTFPLAQLILGWQDGLTLIGNGGTMTLYLPPALGYGGVAQVGSGNQVTIPAYSILVFKLQLTNVQ
jgi:FKBP-type peptidyl-prolyl cis-trans isomerase FkpA